MRANSVLRLQVGICETRFEGTGGNRLRSKLESVAIGVAHVLERSPAPRVLVYHDLILGDDLEYRGIEARPAGNDRLDAEFAMTAAARIQGEVQPGDPATAVGQLDQSRRLETASHVAVNAGGICGPEDESRDRRRTAVGLRAAVVAVGEEEIGGPEPHAARAHAIMGGPSLGEFPFALREHPAARHLVVLVSPERARYAVVVHEPLAPLLHGFVFDAGGQAHARNVPEVAQGAATIVGIEIDHSAAGGGAGKAEILFHPAVAAIRDGLHAVRLVDQVVERQSDLFLVHRLARVELNGLWSHLARILIHQRAAKAKRVLRLRLPHGIPCERQRRVRAEEVFQLAVGEVAVRRAVLAIALSMEMRQARGAAELAGLAAELRRVTPGAIAAEHEACLGGRDFRTIFRLDADHASGSVAVKAGERAAQHLDALRRAQVEAGRLPVPVGHAGWNAVGDEADAAHAEGRARAEAARGDLQVLGVRSEEHTSELQSHVNLV